MDRAPGGALVRLPKPSNNRQRLNPNKRLFRSTPPYLSSVYLPGEVDHCQTIHPY